VHQRRRIQRLAGPFLRDLLRCQPPQLVVDQWLLPTEGRRSRGCRLYSTNQTAKRRNPVSAPIRTGAGSPSPPKATARPHVLRRRPQSGTVRPGAGDPEGGRLNRGFSQKRLCFTHSAPRTYRSLPSLVPRTARRVFESQTPSLAHAKPVDVALEMISGSGRQFARGATRFLAPFHS
jgi:hypothetical protein